MTKYEGHWPELYVEVCNKYRQPVLQPPERLEDKGVLAIKDLDNPTPACPGRDRARHLQYF
eukprot:7112838-Heterocapsa_arctica.AAC.1